MTDSFQFLNSRDLLWSRTARRCLLGGEAVGRHMMSWKADLTRLPQHMHNEYLPSLLLNDALVDEQYDVSSQGLALRDSRVPLCEESWWPAMHHLWLEERSGLRVPARTMEAAHVLGDAPGDHVMVRDAN